MKTLGLSLLLVFGTCLNASGWGGTLNSPLFGYSAGIGVEQEKKATVALRFMSDELKFIDGSFINEYTSNRFGGTSQQTARFIQLLEESGVWKVSVQFRDFKEQKSALMLSQVMTTDDVTVTVNSGRDDFRLKDFRAYLPGPERRPEKAKGPVAAACGYKFDIRLLAG